MAAMNGHTANVAGVEAYWTSLPASQISTALTRVFNWLYYGWTPQNPRFAKLNSDATGKYLRPVKPQSAARGILIQ